MKWIIILMPLAVLVTTFITDTDASCIRWDIKGTVRNSCYISDQGPLATYTVASISACALKCARVGRPLHCDGANFLPEFGRCELYDVSGGLVTSSNNCPGHDLVRFHGHRGQKQISKQHSEDFEAIPCGPGWLQFGTHCYLMETSQQIFVQADRKCQSHNAALVSVHSTEENQFVSWLARTHSQSPASHIYIGLIKHKGNKIYPGMIWTDSTPYNFNKWRAGEPDRLPRDAVCVHMDIEEWTWSDGSCLQALAYVCKKPAGN